MASPRSTVTLQVFIDAAADPISGSLVYPDGRQEEFHGWIELTAALEEARQLGTVDIAAHSKESDPARRRREADEP